MSVKGAAPKKLPDVLINPKFFGDGLVALFEYKRVVTTGIAKGTYYACYTVKNKNFMFWLGKRAINKWGFNQC